MAAIELKPDFADAYNNRGIAYSDKDDFDQAIQDYNKAVELNPNDADAYNNRGNAYEDKGELDQAMQDFDKAIELKPDFAEAYFNRGCTWLHLGEWEKAKADLTTAPRTRVWTLPISFVPTTRALRTLSGNTGLRCRKTLRPC